MSKLSQARFALDFLDASVKVINKVSQKLRQKAFNAEKKVLVTLIRDIDKECSKATQALDEFTSKSTQLECRHTQQITELRERQGREYFDLYKAREAAEEKLNILEAELTDALAIARNQYGYTAEELMEQK